MRRSSPATSTRPSALTDLGDRYLGQDALADAEAAFRGALAIFEAALGPADPRVADSMTALADVRAERRDFTGAESLYQRALAVNEIDRKSTRLNSSHGYISYAVF